MWTCPPFPCPPTPCPPQYQPLPISTGNVGIDRCGNIDVYAAPNVVHRQVCWPAGGWPIPNQNWWGRASGWGSLGNLAAIMTQGAPMADWMIQARQQGSLP